MYKSEIAIILLTYNRARLLERCLESVFKQKGVNFEVLIFDNFSTDNTVDIVRKFKNKHENIFYHRNLNNIGFAEMKASVKTDIE